MRGEFVYITLGLACKREQEILTSKSKILHVFKVFKKKKEK